VSSRRSRARALAQLDVAVVSALGYRAWQAAGALVTIWFVAHFLSLQVQGVYYAFSSVLALQTLSDLGLFIAIVNTASHEWSRLRLEDGQVRGDFEALSRLASLARQLIQWYGLVSAVSGALVGLLGYAFFARTVPPHIPWTMAWAALVIVSSAAVFTSPLVSLLEGCGQVTVVNQYRLSFAIVSSAAGWLALALGLGLWALPAMIGCAVLRDVVLVLGRYRQFFRAAVRRPAGPQVDWRREIWPLQWRLALQGLSQFGAAQTFTPVLLYFEGPGPAGRMGMTWSVVGGIQSVALAWIQVRVPALGRLVAIGDRLAFEKLWIHASALSVAVTAAAGAALCAAVSALGAAHAPFALRLLSPWPTVLLVMGICCAQVVQCLAAYVRAHKSEALMPVGVTSSMAIAALAVILGSRLGSLGIALGYVLAMGGIGMPVAWWLWLRFRRARAVVAAAP
jgi:hypothetical protein